MLWLCAACARLNTSYTALMHRLGHRSPVVHSPVTQANWSSGKKTTDALMSNNIKKKERVSQL